MRAAIFLSTLAVAYAAPAPQMINIGAVEAQKITTVVPPAAAATDAVVYNAASAASKAAEEITANGLLKRTDCGVHDPCCAQPDGFGPVTSPDTADAFLANSLYSAIADGAPVPQGYSLSFSDLQASISAPGYLGLYTLKSYDTIKCQQLCDAEFACYGFNIYIERDPSLNPANSCPDPASITNYKCTLWGAWLTETATNRGQWREQFQVVIAGSNGYSKLDAPPAQDGFKGPTRLGGAIDAPPNSAGQSTYIGMRFFPGVYDPSQCAAACTATTDYNRRQATNGDFKSCNFFNSYVLSEDNVAQGTYCSFYTQEWDARYATNYGQHRGDSYYSVSQSYAYTAEARSQKLPDTATQKAVAEKDPLDLSVMLQRFLSLDRSTRITKVELTLLQESLKKRFGTAPTVTELKDIRKEYLMFRGDIPFRETWGFLQWAARARSEWMINKDNRIRILDLTPDAVCYRFPEYGVMEEGTKRIRDAFRPLVIPNALRH
ncbi:hypothetical protein H2199_007029 [Coniosporium tulheliwenetii]|uniref:Uncharacterized protein n=1 Tax=Coniosporium tulheliwenetii TaxID=3383036 RepID=A0ACC2YSL3_9PEZI|nr:hypothetical protein H2199_007029 [Cladosporium sp. JES 115]